MKLKGGYQNAEDKEFDYRKNGPDITAYRKKEVDCATRYHKAENFSAHGRATKKNDWDYVFHMTGYRNGEVEVTIRFKEPLKPKHMFRIKRLNGGENIVSFKTTGMSVRVFSTFIRYTGGSEIYVCEILDQKGNVVTTGQVYIEGSVVLVKIPNKSSIEKTESLNVRVTGGVEPGDSTIDVPFSSGMARNDYVKKIRLKTDVGSVSIDTSPYLVEKPSLFITVNKKLNKVEEKYLTDKWQSGKPWLME